MPIELWTAPLGGGKTEFALDRALRAAPELPSMPRVCVPSRLQANAFQRRLAHKGGALGIRVDTFRQMLSDCLDSAHASCVLLSDSARYHLLRSLLDGMTLTHYAPLRTSPGFLRRLASLISELKRQMVSPEDLARGLAESTLNAPRLRELALVYQVYQHQLAQHNWADEEELTLKALNAIEEKAHICADWPLLIIDGFDSFTPIQLRAIRLLSERVGHVIVTLTEQAPRDGHSWAHEHFENTLRLARETLGVIPQPLPPHPSSRSATLHHLATNSFRPHASRIAPDQSIQMVETPTRGTEVRAALRWVKKRWALDGIPLTQMVILARDLTPYLDLIAETAREFGLPISYSSGLPLVSNPAVAALFDLVELFRPVALSTGRPEPWLPRRLVLEAWRSPYFNWQDMLPGESATRPVGITLQDAEDLARAATHGQVIAGWSHWQETLTHLADLHDTSTPAEEVSREPLPVGPRADELLSKLSLFRQRLLPPTEGRLSTYVEWFLDLVGVRPGVPIRNVHQTPSPTDLGILAIVHDSEPDIRDRDLAALERLIRVLRNLAQAESLLGPEDEPIPFDRFLDEVRAATLAASYHVSHQEGEETLLISDLPSALGLSFRAAVLMGLSEGEFPRTLAEDPLLRESDRRALRASGLGIESKLRSHEAELFCQAITRATERMCFTRPCLTDDGVHWQESPFWEEVTRLVHLAPREITSLHVTPPAEAASWPEVLQGIAHCHGKDWDAWASETRRRSWEAVQLGSLVLRQRRTPISQSVHEGTLSSVASQLTQRYGDRHVWSASRLEDYRLCPFLFFTKTVLRLEPAPEPGEGMTVAQLGTIYHRILEQLYASVADTTDLDDLLAALPMVATRVLDEAPQREGFSVTAWWEHIRTEIEDVVLRTVKALNDPKMLQGYRPIRFEQQFGWRGVPPLSIESEHGRLLLHGMIDRIDACREGIRVIDYKTAGKSGYGPKQVEDGSRLQLPLYALAARDALKLGNPVDGFYWHVRAAEPSGFRLETFREGVENALQLAITHAWSAVEGIRAGAFAPSPPKEGCPPWCPSVSFCWHYKPRFGS